MTPINAADRPKIITLGVLSVIMFGYFAKTLLGAMGDHAAAATPPPTPAPAPVATATPAVATTGAPTASTVAMATAPSVPVIETGGPAEPFRKVLPEPGQMHTPTPVKTIRGGATSFPMPTPSGAITPMPVMGGSIVATSPVPKTEPAIRLDGVVTDRENCAVVSVGDKSDIIRAGRTVGGVYKLLSVDEQGANFRGPSGVFRLEVGQQHTAPTAAPAAAQPSASAAPMVADASGMLPLPSGR